MPEIFDSENLTERINKIRKEGEDSTEFTLEYLQCLMERHNLGFSIPTDFSDPDVPQIIFETLTSGELPTKEQILLMDSDTQNHLIIELIWLCGMYAIHNYSVEWGEDYLESILAMLDVDAGHFIGCYLISVFTLLMGTVPSISLVESLTNNFDCSPEILNKTQDIFLETAYSILLRWKEDQQHY
jgi:hypothetical protein